MNRYGNRANEEYIEEQRVRRPKKKAKKEKHAPAMMSKVDLGNLDTAVFLVVIILVLIGVVMVFSASYAMAANRARFNNDAFYFLWRNGAFAIAGFAAMYAISRVNYQWWRTGVWLLYFGTIVLLVVVAIMGRDAYGATRWLGLPVIGQFQPMELAKPAVIFAIAHLVDKYPAALKTWGNLGLFGMVVGIPVGLVMMPGGFSSGLIVGVIGAGMIFIASPHIWRFVLLGGALVGAAAGYLFMSARLGMDFRGARIQAWLAPFDFPDTVGFQTINALYAVATGGFFGIGIGESRQVSFIPEPHHDMIFAIIVEELGLVGASIILMLFGIFIWRGIVIAMKAPDTFSAMLAIGIVFAIASQVIINVGVVTNTIPNTGVTLPFISYGGTSLLVSMALAGILLNVSRYSKG